jgi:hypothetical protein
MSILLPLLLTPSANHQQTDKIHVHRSLGEEDFFPYPNETTRQIPPTSFSHQEESH